MYKNEHKGLKMEMLCKKCKSNMFTIDARTDCDDCEYNGWWDESEHGEWKYSALSEDTYRNEVDEEGECKMGTSYGAGCWLVKCTACGEIFHLPTFEE